MPLLPTPHLSLPVSGNHRSEYQAAMVVCPSRAEPLHLSLSIQSSARHQRAVTTKELVLVSSPRWVPDQLLDLVQVELLALLDHHCLPNSTDLQNLQLPLHLLRKAHRTSLRNNINEKFHIHNHPSLLPSLPSLHRHHHHEVGKILWLGPKLSSLEKVMLK